MSLEDALNRNSDLLEKHNDLLAKVLGAAGDKTATPAGDKPKATRSPGKKADTKSDDTSTDDDTAGGAISFADLRAKLSAWLGEFAKDEDKDNPAGVHPEVTARREALAKALASKSVGVKKLPEIEKDADKIATLDNWFETKAKTADKGFGIGRLAADPAEEEASEEDDGMGI